MFAWKQTLRQDYSIRMTISIRRTRGSMSKHQIMHPPSTRESKQFRKRKLESDIDYIHCEHVFIAPLIGWCGCSAQQNNNPHYTLSWFISIHRDAYTDAVPTGHTKPSIWIKLCIPQPSPHELHNNCLALYCPFVFPPRWGVETLCLLLQFISGTVKNKVF